MTSSSSPIPNTNTPSLQISQEAGAGGKEDNRVSLADLKPASASNLQSSRTNFSSNTEPLATQEGNGDDSVDAADKIQRQTIASLAGTATGTFQFRSSGQTVSDGTQATLNLASDQGGQIRVMTVHSNDPGGQGAVSALNPVTLAISSAGGTQASQVLSAGSEVVENNTGDAVTVTVDNTDGTKYTYYPAVQSADSNGSGQFYVMMSPQDMIPNVTNQQRIIAPRGHPITTMGESAAFAVEAESIPVEFRKVETSSRSARDERRRATHNEVERKRRTKINSWIEKLSYLVPECKQDQSKTGQSKGTTLSKTIDYIEKLRAQNERLTDKLKDHERYMVENQLMKQQLGELQRENTLLRANLHMHQQDHQEIQPDGQQMDPGQ